MIQEVQEPNDTDNKTSINNIPPLPQSETRTHIRPADTKQYKPQLSHKEEQQILHSPNFNAKAFISKSLSGATDTQVSKFAEKLVAMQEQLVIDRKDMIYGNYKTFLTVGTQIERARNLREVDDLINDLDVKIAHRKFKDAVAIIQKSSRETADIGSIPATVVSAAQAGPAALAIGNNFSISSPSKTRKGRIALNTTTLVNTDIKTLRSQLLKVKLDERTKELTDVLLADISQDYLGPSQMKNHIQLLIQLGQPEAVKKAFLGSRRQLINKRIKRVEFKGEIPTYIAQVATIHFRMIRTTVDIYQACYPQKEYASSIVEWAKAEVEDFVVTFARQLYNVEPKSDIYIECANITKEQSAQLTKVGLNLDFLLDYIYEGPKK